MLVSLLMNGRKEKIRDERVKNGNLEDLKKKLKLKKKFKYRSWPNPYEDPRIQLR